MERDRVAAFDGELVTSSVLHGALMQYDKEDFLGKVTDSLPRRDVHQLTLPLTLKP